MRLQTPMNRPARSATALAMALTMPLLAMAGCGQSNDTKTSTDKPAPASDALVLLEVGAAAPDFTAEAHDGTTVAMKELTGQPVVVYFYPKDATPG